MLVHGIAILGSIPDKEAQDHEGGALAFVAASCLHGDRASSELHEAKVASNLH